MASDQSLSHSVLHASAEVVEHSCGVCLSRDKKEIESTKYCVDCDSNLCTPCTEWHADFSGTKAHQVVDITQSTLGPKQMAPLPTQRCQEHHGRVIDKFCLDHEELGCDSCISMYHRNCQKMGYIPVISKGSKKGKDFQAIIHSNQSLLKALNDMKSSQQVTLQELDAAELQCMQDIQDDRDTMVKIIDELAKADTTKVKAKFQEERVNVTQNLTTTNDRIDATDTIIKNMNGSKGDNESEVFVFLKQGEKMQRDGKQVLQTLEKYQKKIPKYRLHHDVETSLREVKSLGEFYDEPINPKRVHLQLKQSHDVQTDGDEKECNIQGVCLLSDATVIVTDYDNKRLKHLDSSYKIISHLDMPGKPFDVCFTDNLNCEVAVTLRNERSVQFVRVGARMGKTRSFTTDEPCSGIAYSRDELFVCCGRSNDHHGGYVQVFDMSGKALRRIQKGPAGQGMFSVLHYITVSSCGILLHITDKLKGVITTDRMGNYISTFSDPALTVATGICTLDKGDLLVCGVNSPNILHVSMACKKLGVHRIIRSTCMTYDCINSRVIGGRRKLHLFDVVHV